MPVTLTCEVPGCGVTKTADSDATALGMLQLHNTQVHSNTTKQKPPKVDRPRITRGLSGEEWATIERKWGMFTASTVIGQEELNSQLLACCDTELENALYQNCPDLAGATEATLLQSIKDLSVIEVAETVRVTELLSMRQAHGEPVRAFVARLRGKAQICPFQVKCGACNVKILYADHIVRWVLLAGLASPDIARDVLGTTDIDKKSLTDTISLIEAKERAARALALGTDHPPSSGVAAARLSSYKRSTPQEDKVKCAVCSKITAKFGKNRRGQIVEYKFCTECFRASRRKRNSGTSTQRPEASAAVADTPSVFEAIGGITSGEPSTPADKEVITSITDATNEPPLANYLYDKKHGWHTGDSKPQPCVTLFASIDHSAYHRVNRPAPTSRPAVTEWISDTGAQSCLANHDLLQELGLDNPRIIPVKRQMRTATHRVIQITGAIFLKLEACGNDGNDYNARVMVYISPQADAFYLSRHAQEQLQIIPKSYPQVGAATAVHDAGQQTCNCPTRAPPPGRPQQLPFQATKENNSMMRSWLVDRYKASTFNKCPHQPLPLMTGPAMKMRTDESTLPSVTHRPAKVPIHWKTEVKSQLDRDVALGVIEKVPPGTPVTWLHNMVLTPKADGSPRRTVDLQSLNKASVRETHHVIPPAQQARSVPKNQLMTVFDAWNGYHSIPIDPADRHKTTFITEHGRYRYCRAPMGYSASGDAYTHRYDMIVADVERLLKVVDDTLIHDDCSDREAHWWRVIDYLELCGLNGVILNPEPGKFQFSEEEVDFTAFRISATDVRPLPKYLDGIRNFPRPTNITDARSWFGLVNQVAHYGRLVDIMAPFRPLLSPKSKFEWSESLEDAFQKSKDAIIEAISQGVEIYDPNRITCLQTDYSGRGVGYWLRQKYCDCISEIPDCCPEGWRVTLAGSRSLRDAEKRYAPIEGESLAVAWALEDTRWFTLGCPNLIIATDHKPLLKILGDKCLDSIINPRLFRLKQRTLMWSFRILFIAGRSNYAADASSRHPSLSSEITSLDALAVIHLECGGDDGMETDLIASMQAQSEVTGAVSWCDLRRLTGRWHSFCH